MPLNLDGMAVLGAIAAHPRLFASVQQDAAKYAKTLVIKQLKAKNADLATLREVARALGRSLFPLIIDAMTDPEVKSVLGKVDKYHPELKTETPAWRRNHLRALADSKLEQTEKPKKPVKAKAPSRRKKAEPKFLDLQSMKATRRRG